MSITLLNGHTPRILSMPEGYAVDWDEKDAEGHEIITYGFATHQSAERAIEDMYIEQCGQANELARDVQHG